MHSRAQHLTLDAVLIVISVVIAFMLAKSGALSFLFTHVKTLPIIGSFISGIFFISVFTAAPAAVVLVEISKIESPFAVAFFGGLGALIGDAIVFRFIKDTLTEDIRWLLGKNRGRIAPIFNRKLFRWFMPFFGALIIASPLPDELGLAIMGFSRLKMIVFIPLAFTLNFLGILIIALLAGM